VAAALYDVLHDAEREQDPVGSFRLAWFPMLAFRDGAEYKRNNLKW
jgi:hypothetical protein